MAKKMNNEDKARDEIVTESSEVHNQIIELLNKRYENEDAGPGSILGVVVVLQGLTSKIKNKELQHIISLLKISTARIAYASIDDEDEEYV